jgi:ribosome-associated protein
LGAVECVGNKDDGNLEIAPYFTIPEAELQEAASRSSGPGGQHVNKTNTRVTLRWNIRTSAVLADRYRSRLFAKLRVRLTLDGDLIVHAEGSRSRTRNREQARERMAELVAEALTEKSVRHATRPSRSSKFRVKKTKLIRSQVKRGRGRVSRDES